MTLAACSVSILCWRCDSSMACSSWILGSACSSNLPRSEAVRYLHTLRMNRNMGTLLFFVEDHSAVANVLVTGGGGFIGSHLVEALTAEPPVRVIDSFITGRRENLEGLDVDDVIEGSINDSDVMANAADGAAVIFHEAAIPRVPRSVAFP